MRALHATISFLLLTALTGCYTKRARVPERITAEPAPPNAPHAGALMTHGAQSRPATMLPGSGPEEFLTTRLKERGLPGLPRNATGSLEATLKLQPVEDQFPVTRVLRFIRAGDPNPYVYTVQQTEQPPGWRVVTAAQIDANGKILKQFEPE